MSARDIERIKQLEIKLAYMLDKIAALSGRVVTLETHPFWAKTESKNTTLGLPKK